MGTDKFLSRHLGPREEEIELMLEKIGVKSLDQLISETIPASIMPETMIPKFEAMNEYEYLNHIKQLASKNRIFKTYIGLGYYNTATPSVVWRNIFENPSWYTSYTPYQAEISQGRLEALLNFQTVVSDLTGCELANASLLDEATAAAEAMIMMFNLRSRDAVKQGKNVLFVDSNIFPQSLAVIQTRAFPLGIEVKTCTFETYTPDDKAFGAVIQYPAADGKLFDYSGFVKKLHDKEILTAVGADLLSLALLTPPGEWGADIVFGSTQRFGIPMGFGGPHAAYFATQEKYKRNLPGRIIGITKDIHGNRALRMALQTREQHIKREKASSNICTSQALLATMAGMFAVYHGPEGIKNIASDIYAKTHALSEKLSEIGYTQANKYFFDTLKIVLPSHVSLKKIQKIALSQKVNFRYIDEVCIGISIDETTSKRDLNLIVKIFSEANDTHYTKILKIDRSVSANHHFARTTNYLTHPVFKSYRSETEMMRYIKRLERKDISLTHSMISLGSCTMKLNSATLMMPLSNPQFGDIHPFVPKKQAQGYFKLFSELSQHLCEITGMEGITLQPNSGAAGEYTGLMIISEYHISRKQANRKTCLIPSSAHGTNPASAAMAGLDVVVVACDENGNIDIEDLRKKAEQYKDTLNSFMITYPSTHGVFESKVKEMCDIIHKAGGQVYMDGANMNAQVGLTGPGFIGADVCHLNLHKTFAIPHGGGGPGVGPVAVAKHLIEFLPTHPLVKTGGKNGINAVAAGPWGSASVLPITYGYIKMLGSKGLKEVTKTAILNANYLAVALKDYYKILYTGETGHVAHEMILECRNIKAETGISEADIAKRLMDYGFHAPTLSFPVHGTLMIEPTESESLDELNRFVDAMISIYNEIQAVKNGTSDKEDNPLKNAPHTEHVLTANEWKHSYSREQAGFPLEYIRTNKFQIPVGRVDDAFGDRNLLCSCSMTDFKSE